MIVVVPNAQKTTYEFLPLVMPCEHLAGRYALDTAGLGPCWLVLKGGIPHLVAYESGILAFNGGWKILYATSPALEYAAIEAAKAGFPFSDSILGCVLTETDRIRLNRT